MNMGSLAEEHKGKYEVVGGRGSGYQQGAYFVNLEQS